MTEPRLLSGGNPQIPKAAGRAPVAAYLAAMPGWKGDVGQRIDALILEVLPDVAMAVKWNSPLYGMVPGRWFLSLHCFTRFVRVTFFDGTALEPPPAGTSKHARVRYHDVTEDMELDVARFGSWLDQVRHLPGERL